MRKSVSVLFRGLLAASMLVICMACTATAADSSGFTVIRIDAPEKSTDTSTPRLLGLRYSDDKTPIPISQQCGSHLFATIPTAFADRMVEPFYASLIPPAEDLSIYGYSVLDLMARNVVSGDSDGKIHVERPVTRAEAAAMLVRTLCVPLEDGRDSGYDDVPAGAWYAPLVQTAKAYGIVSPDTQFHPERKVTREEFLTMAARAMECAGLLDLTMSPDDDSIAYADASSISDWAHSAYWAFGNHNAIYNVEIPVPFAETLTDNAVFWAMPQQAATRGEVMEQIYRCLQWLPVYPTDAAIEFGLDIQMPVIDGSTSTYPFTDAVYAALFSNGSLHPDKPEAHSKSHASYERLINGEVDMLFASVYPASDILALAEENGVELELIPIAYDAMVFFTNKDNPAENLTSEQISAIYVDNAYDNWSELGGPDALLYPYCRNNDSGSHAQMERHFLHGNEINETIRQETTSYAMQSILTDVVSAKTEAPLGYGLGYSIFYYYRASNAILGTEQYLKLLAVDGIAPTEETIADGSYPLSNYAYVVLRKDTPADAPARRLAAFMLSENGQRCVQNAGYGALQ